MRHPDVKQLQKALNKVQQQGLVGRVAFKPVVAPRLYNLRGPSISTKF
jgi:hypothetical protein